jgi:hypothetical protein
MTLNITMYMKQNTSLGKILNTDSKQKLHNSPTSDKIFTK